MSEKDPHGVRIIDLDMPFGSMVRFMVKWSIAAIPALIILMVIGVVVGGFLTGVTAGLISDRVTSSERASRADSLAPLLLPPVSAPKWELTQSANPIDDSPTVVLSLEASSPKGSLGQPAPALILRCKSKKLEAYINWSSYLGSDEARITLRLGRDPATSAFWRLSTDSRASFYPGRASALAQKMMQVDTLVAAVTPYSESPVMAVFVVSGLTEKAAALREACSW